MTVAVEPSTVEEGTWVVFVNGHVWAGGLTKLDADALARLIRQEGVERWGQDPKEWQ